MDGQLDLNGGEHTDPRILRAAKALWLADARRTWGQDGYDANGQSVAGENAKRLWPRVAKHYLAEARVALTAADGS